MTKTELATVLKMLSVNYSKTVDNALMDLWYDFFKDFELKMFQSACQKIMSISDYFPKVNEVIATYKELKEQDRIAQYEKMRAQNRLLVQEQEDCFLCDNSGICTYRRGDYEYGARCICAHGRDLNKFSRAQIDKNYIPEIKQNCSYTAREIAYIKDGINPLYLPTVKELLGGDFVVYEAEKKAQKLGNKNLSDEDKLKILQGGYELQWQNPQR